MFWFVYDFIHSENIQMLVKQTHFFLSKSFNLARFWCSEKISKGDFFLNNDDLAVHFAAAFRCCEKHIYLRWTYNHCSLRMSSLNQFRIFRIPRRRNFEINVIFLLSVFRNSCRISHFSHKTLTHDVHRC